MSASHGNDDHSIVFGSDNASEPGAGPAADAGSVAFDVVSLGTNSHFDRSRLDVRNAAGDTADVSPTNHSLLFEEDASPPESRRSANHHPLPPAASRAAVRQPSADATTDVDFTECTTVASAHSKQFELAHTATSAALATSIQFDDEDKTSASYLVVDPTDDGASGSHVDPRRSTAVAHQQQQRRTPEHCTNASISFAQDEETKDSQTDSTERKQSAKMLQAQQAAQRALKAAEHDAPWNAVTTQSPHHARYSHGHKHQQAEQQWESSHPLWNRPKGHLAASGGASTSSDNNKLAEEVANRKNSVPVAAEKFPFGQHGPRAKDYSEKVRSEARQKSMGTQDSSQPRNNSVSLRDVLPESKEARNSSSMPRNSTTQALQQDATSPVARRNDDRAQQKPQRPKSLEGMQSSPSRRSTSVLKAQVEQWMSDHVNNPPSADVEMSLSSPSSEARISEKLVDASPPKSPAKGPKKASPVVENTLPAPAVPEEVAGRHHPHATSAPPVQPDEAVAPVPSAALADRTVEFFNKLYSRGGKKDRELYVNEQVEREELEMKLRRLQTLHGMTRGQREFDKLYGPASHPQQQQRSATPPAWQRLYTTPQKKVADTTAVNEENVSGRRDRPASARKRAPSPKPVVPHGPNTVPPALPGDGTNAAAPEAPGIFTRLYRQGVTEMNKKKRMSEEAEDKRLKKELEEIEAGKVLAQALRQKSGHQPMTREQYEAFLKSQVGQPESTEPKVTENHLLDICNRLSKQKKKKPIDDETRDKIQLKECTFHPVVNAPRFTSPNRGRKESVENNTGDRATSRSPSCDRACMKLFQMAEKNKVVKSELFDRVDRERKLKILKAKMNCDHHFLRRVQIDPSVAEAFLESLPPQT